MMRALVFFLSVLIVSAASAEPAVAPSRASTSLHITSPASIGAPHICVQDYPADAIAAHAEGTTIVGFTITEAGTTTNTYVVGSSGNQSLDDAAIACTSRWIYRPAMQEGKPVAVPWKAEVHWMLNTPGGVLIAATPVGQHDCEAFRPRRAKVPSGAVTTVRFVITAEGDVANVDVAISSGNGDLDAAAVKCAGQWHYNPAKMEGQPVSVRSRENIAWTQP